MPPSNADQERRIADLERRNDRLERALVELARRHAAMLGRMGPKCPELDELVADIDAKAAA